VSRQKEKRNSQIEVIRERNEQYVPLLVDLKNPEECQKL
jgi:hypothetical protein